MKSSQNQKKDTRIFDTVKYDIAVRKMISKIQNDFTQAMAQDVVADAESISVDVLKLAEYISRLEQVVQR